VKDKCQKCGKIWQGWAQPAICPDCGGKLEIVEDEKKDYYSGKERRVEEDRRKFDDRNYKGSERRSGQRRKNEGCEKN